MLQPQPKKLEFTNSEPKPLGLVWIKCAYSTLSLGLEEMLKAHAHVHREQKPPVEGTPSLVILCPRAEDSAEKVASELKHLQVQAPGTLSVVLGLHLDLPLVRVALEAGACGFIHIGMGPEQIVRTLRVVSEGAIVFPRELLNYLAKKQPQGDLSALTHRQLEILELVAEGKTNAQIAHRLFLSESAIKQQLRAVYKTLGVRNRIQAARLLRRNNPGQGQLENL